MRPNGAGILESNRKYIIRCADTRNVLGFQAMPPYWFGPTPVVLLPRDDRPGEFLLKKVDNNTWQISSVIAIGDRLVDDPSSTPTEWTIMYHRNNDVYTILRWDMPSTTIDMWRSPGCASPYSTHVGPSVTVGSVSTPPPMMTLARIEFEFMASAWLGMKHPLTNGTFFNFEPVE